MRRTATLLLAAALSVAVATAASCSRNPMLPSGQFSGSDAADRRVTVAVEGGKVRVNGQKARFVGKGVIEAQELPGTPRLRCRAQADGEELRCEVAWPDRTETIDLLRI